MGRARNYDEAAVLTAAMHVFRRQGYEGASIRDLEEATGLRAGSIYNSFGDKAGLFDAAFAHYNRTVLQRRIERFAAPRPGLGGLRKLFLSLLEEPGGGTFGCLITNSAVELCGQGKRHPCVVDGLRTLEETFAAGLAVAREKGTLRDDCDLAGAAAKLLALYQGVLVLVRAGYPAAAMKKLINQEFDLLEHER